MKHIAPLSSLLMTALAALFVSSAGASDVFVRPVFTPDREFVVLAPVSITWVESRALPVRVGVFNHALSRCGLTPGSIQVALERILLDRSTFWGRLDQLFWRSHEALRARGVTVLIDDFSQFAGDRPDFASYYFRGDSPLIGLDCSRLARSYWAASLAHEVTHALMDGSGAESWWEEGVAQLLEREVGGEQPNHTTRHLESVTALPALTETRRPLSSRASYAMNGLFVRYLRSVLGGWSALRAMVSESVTACESSSDFLSLLACRAQTSPQPRAVLPPDRLTRAGFLRHFAVALTLNDRSVPMYSIPGWDGWNMPHTTSVRRLAAGGFTAWRNPGRLEQINPALEAYRVISNGRGAYRILPREQALDPVAVEEARRFVGTVERDFLLVINLTFVPLQLF